MFKFWSKTQSKNAKRRKIERPTKRLSRIFDIFSILTPKIQNFNFSNIITYKIKNRQVIQKIRKHVF